MNEANKAALVEAIEAACDSGYGEVSFRASYSGRGMYGKPCIGIEGSSGACMKLIASVISDLASEMVEVVVSDMEDPNPPARNPRADFDEMVAELMTYSSDTMGYDKIIYWSDLEKVEDEEFEDEEEGVPA